MAIEIVILVCVIVAWAAWAVVKYMTVRHLLNDINTGVTTINTFVSLNFLVQPCGRCHESQMLILKASPNARSVQCRCTTCNKEYWMAAATSEANRVTEMLAHHAILTAKLLSYGQYLARAFPNQSVTVLTATAPDAPLPFERTTREAIPETIRSEVWRRDGGRCVKCRANQNLEFDHVIPVALGGATTARNLQLLCRSCNREKSQSI
jgi:hypothetical protein